MKHRKEVIEKMMGIAKMMDSSSEGVKGIYCIEMALCCWFLNITYNDVFGIHPELKRGQRNTFFQDKLKELK